MTKFMRVLSALMIVVAIALTTTDTRADALPSDEIQQVITQQIDAFRRDDANRAYSYAAPSIQAMFQSPDTFMAMVKSGYRPVYRPSEYSFERLEDTGREFVQYVDIVGPEDGLWTARYHLQRQSDGSLKITACHLVKRPGQSV